MENYHNYEENVKNSLDNQNKKMDDIVEEKELDKTKENINNMKKIE